MLTLCLTIALAANPPEPGADSAGEELKSQPASVKAPEPEAAPVPNCQMVYPFVIDSVRDPALPVWDRWQFMRDGVPVSDSQVLAWSGGGPETERLNKLVEDVQGRGSWIYTGLGVSAGGTAISSVGWLLYGQDNVNPTVSLAMGIGGIMIGVTGFLLVADSIQTPVEPFLAPTPRHRLSRAEGQSLVYKLNRKLGVCKPELSRNASENRPPE
ncbi:MAG: hypothetical protein AAFQ82_20750 [Myxococcota bacterium]